MLYDDIKADFVQAIKDKDKMRKEVLSILKSEIEYEAKRNENEYNDKVVIRVVNRLVKRCKEAHKIYADKAQGEHAEKELQEIEIIEKYLPEQLSISELKQIIQNKINEIGASGPKDMGRLMSVIMKDVKGKTDGKVVNSLVRDILTG